VCIEYHVKTATKPILEKQAELWGMATGTLTGSYITWCKDLHLKHKQIRSNAAKWVCSHRPRHFSQPHRRWDRAKVIDRGSNRMDRWIRELIHIRKEQDKSMNWDKGSYRLPHICDCLLNGRQSFQRRQKQLPKRQQKQL